VQRPVILASPDGIGSRSWRWPAARLSSTR